LTIYINISTFGSLNYLSGVTKVKTLTKIKHNQNVRMDNAFLAIRKFAKEHGYCPTRQELANAMSLGLGSIDKTLINMKRDPAYQKMVLFDKTNGQMYLADDSYKQQTSINTKKALYRLKAQGVQLGSRDIKKLTESAVKDHTMRRIEFAMKMKPMIEQYNSMGFISLTSLAKILNEDGHETRYKKKWYPSNVSSLLKSIAELSPQPRTECNLEELESKK